MNDKSTNVLNKKDEQEASRVRKLLPAAPTIDGVLKQYRGAGPGFDALRIGLALVILAYHSVLLSYDKATIAFVNQTFHVFIIALVPISL